MKKLRKTAAILDRVANILICLCGLFSVLALGSVIALLIIKPGSPILSAGISLGEIRFILSEEAMPKGDLGYVIMLAFIVLFRSAFWIAALIIIRRILQPMAMEKPFISAVSINLKKLSYVILIGGGIVSFASMLGDAILFNIYDLRNLFLSEKIIGCTLNNKFDMSFVLGFAILYLLSFVFKYGEELQRLSDETL